MELRILTRPMAKSTGAIGEATYYCSDAVLLGYRGGGYRIVVKKVKMVQRDGRVRNADCG